MTASGTPGTSPDSDRRGCRRNRVFLGGKIAYGKLSSTTDCTIRDLSDRGARVSLPEGRLIPDDVYLVNMKSGIAYEAKVAWRRAPAAGRKFLQSCGLRDASSPQMKTLRHLWMDCPPR
jgi:hypothetical protein